MWSVTWVREEAQRREAPRPDWLAAQSPLGQGESWGQGSAPCLHPETARSACPEERMLPPLLCPWDTLWGL